jgi:hypothetical protein
MKLKAYVVFPGIDPYEMGCSLVYARNRNEARMYGISDCPWEVPYIQMRATRVPSFDEFAQGHDPYSIVTNDELPANVPKFYNNEEVENLIWNPQ